MFRKVAMIFITVFLSSLGRIVQALAVILLLIFYLFLTIRKKPYTTRRLNSLEIASLLTSSSPFTRGSSSSARETQPTPLSPQTSTVTLSSFLVTLGEGTKWVLVATIILSNTIFLYLWIHHFCQDVRLLFATKYLRLFRACCLCCRSSRL